LLQEWGRFICEHIDFADEYGENILYRCSQFGYTDPQPGEAKILCPDMPSNVKKVDIAVAELSDLRKSCIKLWFCAPLKENGHPRTKSELARILRINKGKFKAELWKAKKDLEKVL
jgi:hypothetical protein